MPTSEASRAGVKPGDTAQDSDRKLYDTAYPPPLREAEEELYKQRPKWQPEKLTSTDPPAHENKASQPPYPLGFGLSGGGIRSATFCLGVFQGLAKLGLLGEIDYISSVSGGSYFASFYGRLFTRPEILGIQEIQKILSPDETARMAANEPPPELKLDAAGSAEFRKSNEWKTEIFDWMRENGRFLAPKGGGDLLLGIAVALRNLLTVQLMIAVSVMAILLAAQLLRVIAERVLPAPWTASPAQADLWCSPYLILGLAMALIWVVPPGVAYWMFHLPEAPPQGAGGAGGQPGHLVSLSAILAMLLFFVMAGLIAGALAGHEYWGPIIGLVYLLWVLAFAFWVARVKFPPRSQRQGGAAEVPNDRPWSPPADTRHKYIVSLEDDRLARCDNARNWLSAMLRTALAATLAMLAFGLIDSAGQMLYARSFRTGGHPAQWMGAVYGALLAAAPFAHWVTTSFSGNKKGRHLPISLNLLAGAGAALVLIPVLTGLDLFSHAIAYDFKRPADAPAALMSASQPARVEISVKWVDHSSASAAVGRSEDTPEQNPKLAPCAISIEHGSPLITCTEGGKQDEKQPSAESRRGLRRLAGALLVAALFSFLAGGGRRKGPSGATVFLNRTSLHPIYTARLIRAYLGASNKSRHSGTKGVSEVVSGDDISQERYWFTPEKFFYPCGAPLHLVNMTLNETIDGQSQIEQRDRKGLGMAVGPAGLSVGIRHHAVYHERKDPQKIMVETFPHPDTGEFRVFDYRDEGRTDNPIAEFKSEKPTLGNWTGMSGAAAATGMGFRTSLGVSLLTGLFNVRLGYWWDSGIESRTSSTKCSSRIGNGLSTWLPLQSYLIDEFMSRFHGTARRLWYLSDGGNFENLGGYELIRRRLPLIVIIDAAADPDYDFDDLAGLVRKARLDFNAEIEFLEPDRIKTELKDRCNVDIMDSVLNWYGPLEQLRRGKRADEPSPLAKGQRNLYFKSPKTTRYSFKHAAFARVRYLDSETPNSFLILIKPTMVGDEPADVLRYHSSHPSFPHESTAEQFFDEAQWESYRRLGQHIAEKLFAPQDKGGFFPGSRT